MTARNLNVVDDYAGDGATAPRVTLKMMESRIVEVHYLNVGEAVARASISEPVAEDSPLHLMTLCFAVLDNGFVVTGRSACASPENFDDSKGRAFAYEDMINNLWPLMGFTLRDHLAYGGQTWFAQPDPSQTVTGN